MPVMIHTHEIHPFLPSLGSPLAIDRSRAEQQDIRPLEIAIINVMADKISPSASSPFGSATRCCR
jgi:homoserine O-succinyltransferase